MSWYCEYCDAEVSETERLCPACGRDREGLTDAERARTRPLFEMAGFVSKPRRHERRRLRRRPFGEAVVPGSLRTTNPLTSR